MSDKIAELASGGEQGVTSMWTPSTRVYEITEEGFAGRNLIPAEIGPGNLSPEVIAAIRADAVRGGYMGYLIGKDEKSAMIFAEMKDIDPKTGARIDYFQIAESLETGVREAFENGPYRVRIVGFAQMIASIADDAMNYAPWFFGVSVVLTLIAAYLFTQDIVLALLSAGCSLVSVIWMLGLVQAFGLAIDPIAVLVPFLILPSASVTACSKSISSAATCWRGRPASTPRATPSARCSRQASARSRPTWWALRR